MDIWYVIQYILSKKSFLFTIKVLLRVYYAYSQISEHTSSAERLTQMFECNNYINRTVILYCIVTITMILRTVNINHLNNTFNHVKFLTFNLKH